MCGRFTSRTPTKDIVTAFGLTDAPELKPKHRPDSTDRHHPAQPKNGNSAGFNVSLGLDPFLS
jgi:hypothetical protein